RPGVFLLWWRVPSGPSGPLRLKGTVSGEERWSFQVEAEAVPGPAQRFEMRVEPEVLVASEEAKVEVVVSAWDATGNPTGAGLRLESSLGGEAMLEEQQPGRLTGVLEVAPAFRGSEELEVRLLADGGTTPVLTRRVGLRAAAPEKVRVEPLRSALVADGKAEVAWRISVEDRFGNPVREAVPELPPALLASGSLQPGGEAGTYELRYVPPAADENHSAELEVRVGEVSGRGALTLLRNRPLLLAVRSGVVSNFADVVAPSAGLRLELWPGRPLPDLGMLLDTGYLRFTRTGGEVVPGFSGRNELLEASMALARRLRLGGGVEAWVAGGPTLARVRSRARLGEGPALEEGTWVFGAQALVGGSLPLGPGFPFLEARFFWFDDPSLHVLRGSLRGGGLHLGYRLELF
ncbi:MAG TPA: hypothetical protein VLQ93_18655, partial [Myxococcaceae bacterium]|nr:hypothetical protein [Myxococcaceae bacterium]